MYDFAFMMTVRDWMAQDLRRAKKRGDVEYARIKKLWTKRFKEDIPPAMKKTLRALLAKNGIEI